MNKNIKFIFSIILLLFTFYSCKKDELTVADSYFKITIDGKSLNIDLNNPEYTAGFNVQSFNYYDEITSTDAGAAIITKNRAGLSSVKMMFPDSTVQLNTFTFLNVENSLNYSSKTIDMTLKATKIDAFDQILEATFAGTFIDNASGKNVAVNGEIKFYGK